MNRTVKRIITMLFDSLVITGASAFSYIFLMPYIGFEQRWFGIITWVMVLVYLLVAFKLRMFDKINRYTSIKETLTHAGVYSVTFFLSVIISLIIYPLLSFRYAFLTYGICVVLIPCSRAIWRILIEHKRKSETIEAYGEDPVARTLIVGAGEGGSIFIKSLQNNPSIQFVGIVDDDINKKNTTVFGVPVLGTTSDIEEIVRNERISQITIAIPSLKRIDLEKIVERATKTKAKVNKIPAVEDILTGKYEVNKFKEIDVTDLLGREEVKLDMKKIANQLAGQTILVSGAGGSIGSEICRQIVRFSPKRIILLGHGEYSIYLINRELNQIPEKDFEVIPIIADIQDRERIFGIMKEYQPDRVYHAAAHKHVPMMEFNPSESVKNNIIGTKNMAEAAKEAGVGNFVMISTDKAVNPPNVMGATKRIAEMIVTGLNEKNKTNFVAVRFGNVLNSRGSVIPVFKEQIKNGGPITVTDFRMTRYFMTIPEASRLVLQAGSLAKGGEIFVLDMGSPVKIIDLAKKMIRLSGHTEEEIKIVESGIRPGEKLYEELLTNEETVKGQVYEKIFVGKVNNLPLDLVLRFVNQLETLSNDQLRTVLIEFANQAMEVEEFLNQKEKEEFPKLIYSK
jgi:FlaA1/EpsC-like NDP-sugar epimerase